jgi:hypothetical protein
MDLPFYVFSYNRGPFLRNCVQSIQRYCPKSAITIVDDGSLDPETVEILTGFSRELRVIRQEKKSGEKLGGLYRNMQLALDDLPSNGCFVFIQDDCQVVRPLLPEDDDSIMGYFGKFDRAAFLNPHFLKGIRKGGILSSIRLEKDFPIYFYHFSEKWKNRSVTMYYTDICVGHAGRLREKGFRFQTNETTTAIHARTLFSKMGTMVNPFLMSLPQVPIYRGQYKTWAVHAAEKRLGTEPNAFAPWSEQQLSRFLRREPSVLPFAEDFLECLGSPPKRPFVKESVNAFPVLRLIHKVELQIKKWKER